MREKEAKLIDRVPILKKDPQWNFALQVVQCPTVLTALSPEQQTAIEVFSGKWLLFLHWVIKKKWISKHKVPISPKYVKFYEPKGEQLYRILEMCIQCHSTPWGAHYSNAAQWFSAIVATERGMEIDYVLNESEKAKGKEGNGKTKDNRVYKNDMLYHHWEVIKILQYAGNDVIKTPMKKPYSPNEMPHHYCLIEAASDLARNSDIFKKQFWNPYLAAYRKWIVSLNDPFWQAVWVDQGKLKAKLGRGNGVKTIL